MNQSCTISFVSYFFVLTYGLYLPIRAFFIISQLYPVKALNTEATKNTQIIIFIAKNLCISFIYIMYFFVKILNYFALLIALVEFELKQAC